jgi:hypothetical protein
MGHFFSKHIDELGNLFQKTLMKQSLEIKFHALNSVSVYLRVCHRNDSKKLQVLLPFMVGVITQALNENNELLVEKSVTEFINIAEVEPFFFKSHFSSLFTGIQQIVGRKDFSDNSIRLLPIHFVLAVLERIP